MQTPKENNHPIFTQEEIDMETKDNVVGTLSVIVILLIIGFVVVAVLS